MWMIFIFLICVTMYYFYNYLSFIMMLELGEVMMVSLFASTLLHLGVMSIFLFIFVILIISFAIFSLVVLVSNFNNQGYSHFMMS